LPSYHRVTTLLREEVNLVLRRLRTPAEALDSIATRLDAQVLRQADANRLHEVIEYLKDNLHLELSREEIAARCNLNPSYFSSLFKELTGETFRRFVNRERIRKAQRLLVTSEQSAGEIARSVGFTDPSYFSQVFREYIGMTPIEHRSQARRRMGHH
jgi:AraC-like DNA-binding protein